MRILHVVYECDPTRHRGGVQKSVLGLATAQARLGHDVVVATLTSDGPARRFNHEGVQLRTFRPAPWLRRRYSWQLGSALRKESNGFDVVHTHNTFSPLNVTARRLASHWSAPLFVHPHGALDPSLFHDRSAKSWRKRLYIKFVETRTLMAAAGVFALTASEAEWVRVIAPTASVTTVPNGIEIPEPTPPRPDGANSNRSPHRPTLLYIGRFVPKKNLEMLFEVVGRVCVRHTDVHLILCGERDADPTYVERLDALAASLGLEGCIQWAGFVGEAEKSAIYASADVFLHSSISEGMPMAVLEAMAAGLPCVVTPGTMMGDAAVRGGVIERSSIADFATAVEDLLTDGRTRADLAAQARVVAASDYAWSSIAERVLDTYAAAVRR